MFNDQPGKEPLLFKIVKGFKGLDEELFSRGILYVTLESLDSK